MLRKFWKNLSYPKKFAGGLFLLGSAWIILTEILLVRLNVDTNLFSILQIVKDWLFILIISALIFYWFGSVWESLIHQQDLLKMAGKNANLGGWSVELPKFDLEWSDQTAVIHELPPGTTPTVEEAINFYAPEYRDKITAVFQACVTGGIPYEEELQILTAKGNRVWVRTIGEAVKNELGEIVRVQGSFQDIAKRKELEQELLSLATHDQLTGLLRPHIFYENLDHAVKLAQRSNTKIAVLFIDLDNLKKVNDRFGHRVGDEYIKKFAYKLKEGLRLSDSVARLGGDEFGACLENISSFEQVSEILERLRSSLAKEVTIGNHNFSLNYSLACRIYPDDEEEPQALLTDADNKMYESKNATKKKKKNPEVYLFVQRQELWFPD